MIADNIQMMAIKHGTSVIVVISDSEDDAAAKSTSPLTLVKPRVQNRHSTKRKVKRLSGQQSTNQTKLDSFFQTITIKSARSAVGHVNTSKDADHEKLPSNSTHIPRTTALSKTKPLLVPLPSKAAKRTAVKGNSPLSKVASKARSKATEKPNIAQLKGMLVFNKSFAAFSFGSCQKCLVCD